MEKELKKVEATINALYDLHQIHMASFDNEILPDLEKQSKDRELEVRTLVKCITRLIQTAEKETRTDVKSIILGLNERVTGLLEQNKALQKKVIVFRDELKERMNQVSKGKKVIGSYRSSAAVSNNPKVISITSY